MKILDIGCGNRKYKSKNYNDTVIGVDININSEADVICDIQKGLPFKNEEFDLVYASHILEHLNNPEFVIKEVYRVLKKNGIFIVKVPHYSSATAVSFLEHKHFFNLNSFRHPIFTNHFNVKKIKLNYCVFRNTPLRKIINAILSFFANLHPRFCESVWCYWVGGFSEIEVEMVKK